MGFLYYREKASFFTHSYDGYYTSYFNRIEEEKSQPANLLLFLTGGRAVNKDVIDIFH